MTTEELKVVVDMVRAYCGEDTKLSTGEKLVDSGAIGINAAAMRLLVRYGLMEIENEAGRRIRARWTAAGQQVLKPNPAPN
jgi:hypothetical protein